MYQYTFKVKMAVSSLGIIFVHTFLIMKQLFTIICTAILFSSCGTKEAASVQPAKLQGTYKVTQVSGTELGMIEPTIIADSSSSKISGYAGCNSYNASFTMTTTNLTFGDMATTRVACIQGMEQERKFLEAMAKVNRHTLENGKLLLFQGETMLITANSVDM